MIMAYRSASVACLMALLGFGALVSPSGSEGQTQAGVPLFLAIPESFPEVEGRVVLLREPGRDVVLLRASDATPETLNVALTLLRRLNASTPRRARQGQMVPVTGYVRRTPLAGDVRGRLDAALTRLKDRPVARLGNLGVGRVIRFRPRAG